MNSPPPQKKQKLTAVPMFNFDATSMPVESLVGFLERYPSLAGQVIRGRMPSFMNSEFPGIYGYPLYFVITKGGTAEDVRLAYELFPEALTQHDDDDDFAKCLMLSACGIGVACSVLKFLVEKIPEAVSVHSALALLIEQKETNYPLIEALEIVLDANPSVLGICGIRMSDKYLGDSILGEAIASGQSKGVLDFLVRKCVAANAIQEMSMIRSLWLPTGGITEGITFCSISPMVTSALQPLLTTLTTLSFGVKMGDI